MMKRNTRFVRRWSELPSELLERIAKKLKSRSDIAKFRSICQTWWVSTAPTPLIFDPKLPRKITFPATPQGDASYDATLLVNAVYLLRHRHPGAASPGDSWLISVEQQTHGKLVLYHALTRERVEFKPVEAVARAFEAGDPNAFDYYDDTFPKCLVNNFSALQVCRGYSIRSATDHNEDVIKVIFWRVGKNWNVFEQEENFYATSPLDALVMLKRNGVLSRARIDHGQVIINAEPIMSETVFQFDDIGRVHTKELILALDRGGRLYGIEHASLEVCTILALNPPLDLLGSNRRKRLAVDWIGDIYMVCMGEYGDDLANMIPRCDFYVFKLNQDKHVWQKVRELKHRILFVNPECCFFIQAAYLPGCRDNCIVFSKGCCPRYPGNYESVDLEDLFFGAASNNNRQLGVCDYGSDNFFALIEFWPGFSNVCRWPRSWVSKDALPAFSRGSINNRAPNDSQNPEKSAVGDAWSCAAEVLEFNENHEEVTSAVPNVLSTKEVIKNRCEFHDQKLMQIREGIDVGESSHTAISRAKYQGVTVNAEFLPILSKVWDKYGDVIGDDCVVQSASLRSVCCEALAKVIRVLQTTTANTLTAQNVEYLEAALSDLKVMGLKVDWLVPFVEKALFLQKNKPLAAALMKLEEAKAEAEELQKKFLADGGSQHELESLTASGPIDLNKGLGEGLF